MSMTIDARQSDFVVEGQVLVIRPNPNALHFICVGRKLPTSQECMYAISKSLEEKKHD